MSNIMPIRDRHIMLLLQPSLLCYAQIPSFISIMLPLRYLLCSHYAQNSSKINPKHSDNITIISLNCNITDACIYM